MDLFTDIEAAEYLKISPQTLRKARCENRGPVYIKLGKTVRYAKSDIDRWIWKNRRLAKDGD